MVNWKKPHKPINPIKTEDLGDALNHYPAILNGVKIAFMNRYLLGYEDIDKKILTDLINAVFAVVNTDNERKKYYHVSEVVFHLRPFTFPYIKVWVQVNADTRDEYYKRCDRVLRETCVLTKQRCEYPCLRYEGLGGYIDRVPYVLDIDEY